MIERLVSLIKYEISKILRYSLDYRSLRLMMSFELILFSFFMYYFTMLKYKEAATLLVIITIPLLLKQIQLAEISDFTFFNALLILSIYELACMITLLALFILIGIIICFISKYQGKKRTLYQINIRKLDKITSIKYLLYIC